MKLTNLQLLKFFHRKDVYALQLKTGAYIPIKKPINLTIINQHLKGEITLGVYCLQHDNTIKWACVDLDGDDLLRMRMESERIYSMIDLDDLVVGKLLEFSGRRGYHVWIFFSTPVPAAFGQKMLKARLNILGLGYYEVFPKQVELNEGRKFGNLVKLPLALHKKVNKFSKIIRMEGTI